MDEAERVFHETAEHYEKRQERLVKENYELKNQLKNKNKKINELKRVINKLNKKKKQNKPHFKNGKRGSYKNGG